MATLDEIFASMPEEAAEGVHDLLIIDPEARTIDVPETESIFGVENDGRAETKYFQAPRYVGNGIDLAACFLRVNFQNANGDKDAHLINDLAISGEHVLFSWELSKKVTQYKGTVQFVLCANLPGSTKVADWHTTLAQGKVLEGLEPDAAAAEAATADVIAQLLQLVTSQTAAVEAAGAAQVANVQTEGTAQVDAVKAAAAQAEADALAEIEAKKQNVLAQLPADYTAMGNQVDKLTRTTAGAIVCEAEGQTIQVHDASDNYLAGLRIFGRSTQDGTPTPEAPVEIVSTPAPVVTVCGRQLANLPDVATKTADGVTWSCANGVVSAKGTAEKSTTTAGTISAKLPTTKGTFFTSGSANGIEVRIKVTTREGRQLYYDSEAFTLDGTEQEVFVYCRVSEGVTVDATVYPMVNMGETARQWEPYVGQALILANGLPGIPVSSGGNYTDANGQQWICDEVDLARGVYVQRIETVQLDGSEPWTEHESGRFYAQISNAGERYKKNGMLCTHAEFASGSRQGGYASNGSRGVYLNRNTQYETVEELTVFLKNNAVVFFLCLLEPVERALSDEELAAWRNLHSVMPTTTILNDAGAHMAVEYVADTKLYIDRKLAEILAAKDT